MAERGAGSAAVAQASGSRTPTGSRVAPRGRVYVEVAVWLPSGDYAADVDADVQIDAGADYEVCVELREAPSSKTTLTIENNTRIELIWQGVKGVCFVEAGRTRVGPALCQPEPCKLTFKLRVPNEVPIGNGIISISASVNGRCDEIPMHSVAIKGAHSALPEFVKELNLELAPLRNERVAVLNVTAHEQGLDVEGHHPLAGHLKTVIPQPSVSLADVDGEKPSIKVHRAVLQYSRKGIRPLAEWLSRVLDSTSDDVSVLVCEHADSRVPWEMLVPDKKKLPLGARVKVMRWTAVTDFSSAVVLDLHADHGIHGSVVSYVDAARLNCSKREQAELTLCASVECESTEHLAATLRELPENVALVFLACHGTLAKDQSHYIELGTAGLPGGTLKALDLEGLEEPPQPPMLVVNACHSARLARTPHGVSGLPEFFLGSFARSFLGTLGAVDERVAAEIGAKLIEGARSKEGIHIPEFLFELRRKAAQEFDGKRFAHKFVTTFMYVYYGSLRGRLQLQSKAGT